MKKKNETAKSKFVWLVIFFLLSISSGIAQDFNNKIFFIINKNSGKVLDVAGGSNKNGANIQQYALHKGTNQQFKLVPAGHGYYFFINVNSGKAMDVNGNNDNVQQWDLHKGTNQQFKLQAAANGYYFIIDRRSGKALDVSNWSKENKANVKVYKLHKGDNQAFKLQPVNDLNVIDGNIGKTKTVEIPDYYKKNAKVQAPDLEVTDIEVVDRNQNIFPLNKYCVERNKIIFITNVGTKISAPYILSVGYVESQGNRSRFFEVKRFSMPALKAGVQTYRNVVFPDFPEGSVTIRAIIGYSNSSNGEVNIGNNSLEKSCYLLK